MVHHASTSTHSTFGANPSLLLFAMLAEYPFCPHKVAFSALNIFYQRRDRCGRRHAPFVSWLGWCRLVSQRASYLSTSLHPSRPRRSVRESSRNPFLAFRAHLTFQTSLRSFPSNAPSGICLSDVHILAEFAFSFPYGTCQATFLPSPFRSLMAAQRMVGIFAWPRDRGFRRGSRSMRSPILTCGPNHLSSFSRGVSQRDPSVSPHSFYLSSPFFASSYTPFLWMLPWCFLHTQGTRRSLPSFFFACRRLQPNFSVLGFVRSGTRLPVKGRITAGGVGVVLCFL